MSSRKFFYLIPLLGALSVGGLLLFYGEKNTNHPSPEDTESTRSASARTKGGIHHHSQNAEQPRQSSSSTFSSPEMADAMDLAQAGRFPEAVEAAKAVSPNLRIPVFSSVFALWANQDPSAASASALALPDEADRNIAWSNVTRIWAEASPRQLADHALKLEEAIARQQALHASVSQWMENNKEEAIQWVSSLPDSVDCDNVISIVARHPAVIEQEPDLAITWGEAIKDPLLKSQTLGIVTRTWLAAAPEEAARYARESPHILPSEREDILVGERFTEHP
ncbi:MAG: hypothetical protein QM627_05440 [Luteolibacter sp.]